MGTLYESILSLCEEKGIKGGRMCGDLNISKSLMTDLKSGRKKSINAETALKIANYFQVSIDRVMGGPETKKMPTPEGEHTAALSPAFFRLKQGLEPYDLSESDADFLVEVYKAHLKNNQ